MRSHARERLGASSRDLRGRSSAANESTDRLRMASVRPEPLLTVAEAAKYIGCCEETIRRAYLARQLNVLRFGVRRVRIRPSALDGWLERGGKTKAA
jgi:excisionase family DNA binding protein